MRQEFKQREIYDAGIWTAWDLWDMYLKSWSSMKQVFQEPKIYDTAI